MRERKLIIRAISAVVTLLMAQFCPLLAQDSKPRGIIVHDPSNLGAEFVQAEVFSDFTVFGVSTSVISPDGKKTQILNNQIKALVSFPANGSSPREYETVADELKEIAPKYPLASSLLSENERILRKRAEELREEYRENMANIAQREKQEAQRKKRIEALRQHRNNQIGRIITFKDNEGKMYENVKLEVIEPDGITIRSGAEKKKILFTAVSEEVREFLGYDPNIAADYKEGKQNGETLVFQGKEITGRVKKVYPHAVIFETASGVFSVPLAHQSQKIREKFNFDERAARQYLEERNKAAQSRIMAEQAMRAERKRRESSSEELFNVIQVLDDGFLVYDQYKDATYALRFAPDLVIEEGSVIDSLSEIVDGDIIICTGYFTENFQYKTISGARKTVKTFLAYRVFAD